MFKCVELLEVRPFGIVPYFNHLSVALIGHASMVKAWLQLDMYFESRYLEL